MKPYFAICCTLIMVSGLVCGQTDAEDKPKTKGTPPKDLTVGGYVPTTTTWVVSSAEFAKYEGKNTCLAGVHRKSQTISIYARGEDPALWKLLKTVDDSLTDHPDIKAYVVIHKSFYNEEGYNKSRECFEVTQDLARAQKLKHIDVALSRSGSKSNRLLGEGNQLRIVYADKRDIKLCENFKKIDLKPDQQKEILGRIFQLAQTK